MYRSRIAAIALAVFAGCSGEATSPAPDVALAPLPLRMTYQIFGTPGPWWRDDANRAVFDRESRECVKQSNLARERAENGAEAAYGAFIECMQAQDWKRGAAPPTLPPA